MAKIQTVTDLFEKHLGAHEYDDFVTKMIKWYYGGGFAKVAWCAISMSYMANELGILDQFGGKNQNVYEMLVDVEAAVKKTGKGQVWRKEKLTKGMQLKRGDVVFILKSDPPMTSGSAKHVTSVYEGFQWKGTGTFNTLGGNQSDYIQKKLYPQSQVYAIFRPDYGEEKKEDPKPAPAPEEHPVLRRGDKSAAVKEMQSDLRKLGFGNITGEEMVADGSYGRITQATVTAFQTICGLKADGICGNKQTWPMIDKLLKMPATKTYAFTDVWYRIGPGPGFKRLGIVEDGTTVEYTTIVDGWIYIPKLGGWSSSSYYAIGPKNE